MILAEIDASNLASGGGLVVAAYAAVQFGRLVAAVVRFGDDARKWLERSETLHDSTIDHHKAHAKHVAHEEQHQATVARLLRAILIRRPSAAPAPPA